MHSRFGARGQGHSRRSFLASGLAVLTQTRLGSAGRQEPRANIRDFGARGDDVTDDTAAIQAAVRSLPEQGGTVVAPAGRYVVDPDRPIELRNGIRFAMSAAAVLRAAPTASANSAVLLARGVHDVAISGGTVIGERHGHLGRDGEWGMGISLLASRRVTIHDVTVESCWGDGIYVGSAPSAGGAVPCDDVSILRCTLRGNRRQGISVVACRTARIEACHISGTGGTWPDSAIDLEPDPGDVVDDVTVEGCVLSDNVGYGMFAAGHNGPVTRTRVLRNEIRGNRRGGVRLHSARSVVVADNEVVGPDAVLLTGAASDVALVNNRCPTGGVMRADSLTAAPRTDGNTCVGVW